MLYGLSSCIDLFVISVTFGIYIYDRTEEQNSSRIDVNKVFVIF